MSADRTHRSPRPPGTRSRAVWPGICLVVVLLSACSADADDDSLAGPTSAASVSSTSGPAASTTVTTDPGCAGTGFTPHRDLRYGTESRLQALDVYQPTRTAGCAPAPIVVWVHGGGFSIGSRTNNIADKARLFTDEGWVFVAVDYRLSPNPASDDPDRIMYPTHEQDVAAALGWLDDHAEEYGGDPERLLLLGHSAGAFIVNLLSTDPSFVTAAGVEPRQVRCTVSLDTEYDVAHKIDNGRGLDNIYRNAFGDDPATWAAGSPSTHVETAGSIPPFLLVTRGAKARTASTDAFAAQLGEVGVAHEVLNANPLSHADVNDAVGRADDTVVTPRVMAFYRGCVAGTLDDPR